jgi:hypothetical protein
MSMDERIKAAGKNASLDDLRRRKPAETQVAPYETQDESRADTREIARADSQEVSRDTGRDDGNQTGREHGREDGLLHGYPAGNQAGSPGSNQAGFEPGRPGAKKAGKLAALLGVPEKQATEKLTTDLPVELSERLKRVVAHYGGHGMKKKIVTVAIQEMLDRYGY